MKKVLLFLGVLVLFSSCDLLLTVSDSNDTMATAEPESSDSWTGIIGTDYDIDYYKIYLSSDHKHTFAVSGFTGDVDVKIYDASGTLVDSSTGSSATTETVYVTPSSSAYYYLKVYAYSSDATGSGYTVTHSSDAVSVFSSASYLSTGDFPYIGAIDPANDDDYYKVYLYSGITYTLGMDNLTNDADLKLYDSSENSIGSSLNSGTDAESIVYTPSVSGYYYIGVMHYLSYTTSYRLTLSY